MGGMFTADMENADQEEYNSQEADS
jgi:hypothetical protein